MKQKILFIINPISGVGRKDRLPGMIRQHLNPQRFEADITYTEQRGHARSIAQKAVKEGYEIVCAVGGDGSVNEIGTALVDTETSLAIIPAGSGNGLARHLRIPLNHRRALHLINEHKKIRIDTAKANDIRFIATAGFGFDALIAKKFEQHHNRGLKGYVQLILKEIRSFQPIPVQIQLDGRVFNTPVFLCTAANSSEFGNGCKISPESDLQDGVLELCYLEFFHMAKAVPLAIRMFTRSAHRSSSLKIIPFREGKITMDTDRPLAHFDGEAFEMDKEVHIKVYPKSLSVLVQG